MPDLYLFMFISKCISTLVTMNCLVNALDQWSEKEDKCNNNRSSRGATASKLLGGWLKHLINDVHKLSSRNQKGWITIL